MFENYESISDCLAESNDYRREMRFAETLDRLDLESENLGYDFSKVEGF